jgi:ribosomal-protein-serine acetyltransferase
MQPELTTGDLLLRDFRMSDVDAVYDAIMESISELSKWMWWAHPAYSKDETRAFIETRTEAHEKDLDLSYAIIHSLSGEFLGSVGINEVDQVHKSCNLGYWVRTGATGCGLAAAAARRLARYGLTEAGLQRIEIVASVQNLASQRVAEKIGAVREGIARKSMNIHGEPHDAYVFSLIIEDLSRQP